MSMERSTPRARECTSHPVRDALRTRGRRRATCLRSRIVTADVEPLSPAAWTSILIATATLAGVAIGRLPGVPLDRAGFALVGAAILLATGIVDLHAAVALVDAEVIILLTGLMLLNEALAEAGFFRTVTEWATRRARRPLGLLVSLVVASGVLSALFLNDTIVLMLTPLVISLARRLRVAPLPYLLALATAANVGSVATITGNPQNLLVSVTGGIGYGDFARALAPVGALGLLVVIGVIALVHRRDVFATPFERPERVLLSLPRAPLVRVSLIALGMLVAFLSGVPVATAALVAGALALLATGAASPAVLRRVDWSLLVLFAGLFVVVGALRETGVTEAAFGATGWVLTAGPGPLAAATALLSNVFSNVPAIMLLVPLVAEFEGATAALLSVAMASTLAGNLTLVGSIANLIVAEGARREGVHFGFWAYAAVGVPITLITLVIGVGWLAR
jgi:Na+/H+ antiporter NhaD/arsenite permease-like protein